MKIIVGSKRGKIEGCPNEIEEKIYEKCSYRHPDYMFTEAYTLGVWDGYIRKYSIKTHTFPSGLLHRIVAILRKLNVDFEVEDRRKKFEWKESQVLDNLKDFKFSLRPYQIDGLIRGLRVPYLIFWWATSAGKTVMFSALIAALKSKNSFRNTLILVSNKDLASQHRKELSSMLETEIGLIEEGRFEPKKITVAVINTLWQKSVRKKEKVVVKYLENIEHLICDEVHHIIDSKMFKQTINKCVNTIARHGFSGTPFSLTTDDLELEAVTGPPLSKVTMTKLIDEGWVSVPHIFMINYNCAPQGGYNYSEVYSKNIVNNEIRNRIISEIVYDEYVTDENSSILLIIRIIKHGEIIKDMLLDLGVDPDDMVYVHGSTHKTIRAQAKQDFKDKKLRIVIASSIWVEGIDIPSVDVLVQADGGGGKEIKQGKGIRSVIQKVGRVIRKPIEKGELDVNSSKENIVRIYDFLDKTNKHLINHSMNRFMTYKMEPGFKVKEVKYEIGKSKASDFKVHD